MIAIALALLLGGAVDAGSFDLETPEITKEDVLRYRHARFEQAVGRMKNRLPENFQCLTLFNDEQELAIWTCTDGKGKNFASLFVWQKEDWARAPGIFASDD